MRGNLNTCTSVKMSLLNYFSRSTRDFGNSFIIMHYTRSEVVLYTLVQQLIFSLDLLISLIVNS